MSAWDVGFSAAAARDGAEELNTEGPGCLEIVAAGAFGEEGAGPGAQHSQNSQPPSPSASNPQSLSTLNLNLHPIEDGSSALSPQPGPSALSPQPSDPRDSDSGEDSEDTGDVGELEGLGGLGGSAGLGELGGLGVWGVEGFEGIDADEEERELGAEDFNAVLGLGSDDELEEGFEGSDDEGLASSSSPTRHYESGAENSGAATGIGARPTENGGVHSGVQGSDAAPGTEQPAPTQLPVLQQMAAAGGGAQVANAGGGQAAEGTEGEQQNSFGIKEWPDGSRYVGEWRGGKMTGTGEMRWADGRRYFGEWLENRCHGRGVLTYKDGRRYEGEYVADKMHGKGEYEWSEGARYVGQYRDHKKHGVGVMTWKTGGRYDGEYVDDKMTGHGMMTWADGRRYEGEWLEGRCTGMGTTTFKSGSRYVGSYVCDKMEGSGFYSFADGRRYEGEYRGNQKHGKGVYMWSDGVMFTGTWSRGSPLAGVLLFPGGECARTAAARSDLCPDVALQRLQDEAKAWIDCRSGQGSPVDRLPEKRGGKANATKGREKSKAGSTKNEEIRNSPAGAGGRSSQVQNADGLAAEARAFWPLEALFGRKGRKKDNSQAIASGTQPTYYGLTEDDSGCMDSSGGSSAVAGSATDRDAKAAKGLDSTPEFKEGELWYFFVGDDPSRVGANTLDESGRTPFVVASERGLVDVVKWYVNASWADVNHRDRDGRTALQAAAHQGHHIVVRFLLSVGAHTKPVDIHGRTSLGLSCKAGHLRTATLIAKASSETEVLETAESLSHMLCSSTQTTASESSQLAVLRVLHLWSGSKALLQALSRSEDVIGAIVSAAVAGSAMAAKSAGVLILALGHDGPTALKLMAIVQGLLPPPLDAVSNPGSQEGCPKTDAAFSHESSNCTEGPEEEAGNGEVCRVADRVLKPELSRLPSCVEELINRTTRLDLSCTRLCSIRSSIGVFKNLLDLSIRAPRVTSLPEELCRCSQLSRLTLRGTALQMLPSSLTRLGNLQILDVRGNSLESLPSTLSVFSSLQVLDASCNYLNALPEDFGGLQALQSLRVESNSLQHWPVDLWACSSLTELQGSNNAGLGLPPDFWRFSKLAFLSLSGNSLDTLPLNPSKPSNGSASTASQLPPLLELDLQKNDLADLPMFVCMLSTLRRLSLGWNRLVHLPREIGTLSKLACLHVEHNRIEFLPPCISRTAIFKTKELYLEGNRLRHPFRVDTSLNCTVEELLDCYWDLDCAKDQILSANVTLLGPVHTFVKARVLDRIVGKGVSPIGKECNDAFEPITWDHSTQTVSVDGQTLCMRFGCVSNSQNVEQSSLRDLLTPHRLVPIFVWHATTPVDEVLRGAEEVLEKLEPSTAPWSRNLGVILVCIAAPQSRSADPVVAAQPAQVIRFFKDRGSNARAGGQVPGVPVRACYTFDSTIHRCASVPLQERTSSANGVVGVSSESVLLELARISRDVILGDSAFPDALVPSSVVRTVEIVKEMQERSFPSQVSNPKNDSASRGAAGRDSPVPSSRSSQTSQPVPVFQAAAEAACTILKDAEDREVDASIIDTSVIHFIASQQCGISSPSLVFESLSILRDSGVALVLNDPCYSVDMHSKLLLNFRWIGTAAGLLSALKALQAMKCWRSWLAEAHPLLQSMRNNEAKPAARATKQPLHALRNLRFTSAGPDLSSLASALQAEDPDGRCAQQGLISQKVGELLFGSQTGTDENGWRLCLQIMQHYGVILPHERSGCFIIPSLSNHLEPETPIVADDSEWSASSEVSVKCHARYLAFRLISTLLGSGRELFGPGQGISETFQLNINRISVWKHGALLQFEGGSTLLIDTMVSEDPKAEDCVTSGSSNNIRFRAVGPRGTAMAMASFARRQLEGLVRDLSEMWGAKRRSTGLQSASLTRPATEEGPEYVPAQSEQHPESQGSQSSQTQVARGKQLGLSGLALPEMLPVDFSPGSPSGAGPTEQLLLEAM